MAQATLCKSCGGWHDPMMVRCPLKTTLAQDDGRHALPKSVTSKTVPTELTATAPSKWGWLTEVTTLAALALIEDRKRRNREAVAKWRAARARVGE